MSRGRIYVDVDDVLAETCLSLLDLFERRCGRRVPFEEVRDFDLVRSFGISSEEHAALMHEAHRPDVLEALEPLPGAPQVLQSWLAQGYEVAIVTGRPATSNASTRRWLERRAIPHSSFDSLDKYGRHRGADADGHTLTLAALARLPFALAVEDQLEMAARLAAAGARTVLLVDRPWNRELEGVAPELRRRIERVRDWSEIARRFPLP